VCRAPADPRVIFLYEVYVDDRAFAAHGASEHYNAFASRTAQWVEKKTVHVYDRLDPR
jgi:quinol monooxygenase YgiN